MATSTKNSSAKRGPRNMTDTHKAALAEGREQGRIVRSYLEAIEDAQRPKRRGRKRTPESIARRLEQIEQEVDGADALQRLLLAQERLDLETELARMSEDHDGDLSDLEAEFINVAAEYAQRKGITYAAFRAIGVPAAALKAAGISRNG